MTTPCDGHCGHPADGHTHLSMPDPEGTTRLETIAEQLHPDDPMNDPAYLEFLDEQEAIESGLAVELRHCYLCEPDFNKRCQPDAGPLRGVLGHGTTPGDDPYDLAYMSCGHALI